MGNPKAWDIWLEVSRAISIARDLAVISDLDCLDSIADKDDRYAAHRALQSAIRVFLEKANDQIQEIEPMHGVVA